MYTETDLALFVFFFVLLSAKMLLFAFLAAAELYRLLRYRKPTPEIWMMMAMCAVMMFMTYFLALAFEPPRSLFHGRLSFDSAFSCAYS